MRIENVNKRYENKVVLSDLSLSFEEGRITALMGRSGVGKTTLLRLLLGLEKPDVGQLIGFDVEKAAVFQEDRLSEPLNAVQNVRLGRRGSTKEEAEEILSSLGLRGHTGKAVSALSGGMRRRVAIARALISHAPLVVLDEPFSGLDDKTKAEILPYVKRSLEGKTVLFVTHDEEEAAVFADEIITL